MEINIQQSSVHYKKEDAYQSLQMINAWIGNIDTKISFALAFVSVLVGIMFSNGVPNAFEKVTKANKVSGVEVLSCLLVVVLYLFGMTTIILLVLALTARVKNFSDKKSIFFFGDIADNTYQDVTNKMNQITEQKLLEDLQSQIWINSKICSKKAKGFNLGLYSFLGSIAVYFICEVFCLL